MGYQFELFEDKQGKSRFRFRAANGNIMAASSGAYDSEDDARTGIDILQVGTVESTIYEDQAGEYRWRMDWDGDTVATSGEGYNSRSDCQHGMERVLAEARNAPVLVLKDA